MSATLPAVVHNDRLSRLRQVMERLGLRAVVQTGAADLQLTRELLQLGLPLTVTAVRQAELEALAANCGADNAVMRLVAGHPCRVLADLRQQLPPQTLYVFGANDLPAPTVRDEMFWVKHGQGAIVVQCDSGRGPRGLADVQDQLLRWSPDHAVETLVDDRGEVTLLALPAPRVHVTFLIEKYAFDYGTSGLSINIDNLVDTLAATGLATANVVFYDQCHHEGREIPLAEISKPDDCDVHLLVSTLHYHSRANPSVELLECAKASGTRVALVWLDKKISRSTPEYYGVADLNVVLDGNDFELPNGWPIFTPKNPVYFHDPGGVRDIGVSLVGEVRYLSQRKAIVERLRQETRVDVQMFATSAADSRRALSIAEYAGLYQRSRISIAMTKDAVRQLKGRVFEVLHCGAMLLCDVNHHVSSYLRPGIDYVTWRDYEDLVAKARYYLQHEDERQRIARSGHRQVVRFYNHEVFWRSLLARLGGTAATFHGP